MTMRKYHREDSGEMGELDLKKEEISRDMTEECILPVGKLESKLLENLVFKHLTYKRSDVKIRSGIGLDCAALDFGDFDCVVSSDPISAAASDIGRLAVHINCNDIATQGVAPMAMTLVLLLPYGTTTKQIEEIMLQAGDESAALGVEIVGGHTEITEAVNKPVVVATCFGKTLSKKVPEEMKPGDRVLMSKVAGLEGTAIICSDMEDRLDFLNKEDIRHGQQFFENLSVVKEGIISGEEGASGMHDVTEGGILGAVWEICRVAGLGVRIYGKNIPVDPVTVKLAKHMDFDYFRLISSGSMVIVAEESKAARIIERCGELDITVSDIGEIVPSYEGCKILVDDRLRGIHGNVWEDIDPPAGDHLYKALNYIEQERG